MRRSNLLAAALTSSLVFTPWTKQCSQGKRGSGCVLTSEARTADGDFVASAMVVQPEGGKLPVLRVGLPLGVPLFRSVSAAVDRGPAVSGAFTVCLPAGCLADIDAPADLDKLRKGRAITLRWSHADGSDASCSIPLAGLGAALDAPPAGAAKN